MRIKVLTHFEIACLSQSPKIISDSVYSSKKSFIKKRQDGPEHRKDKYLVGYLDN